MIGKMINKIRKSKNITLTELANLTGIDIGHLSHIENGQRNPSHKALKAICKALDVPYQQLMYSYDKTLNSNQLEYGIINHIACNKILAVDKISGFIDSPSNIPNSSIAIKVNDDSMEPYIKNKNYVYVEFNAPLNNNDIGIFSLNDKILIRKFILDSGKIILRPENSKYSDICIDNENDNFYIIGKVFNNFIENT